jgi:hypothetical protein
MGGIGRQLMGSNVFHPTQNPRESHHTNTREREDAPSSGIMPLFKDIDTVTIGED